MSHFYAEEDKKGDKYQNKRGMMEELPMLLLFFSTA